MGEKNLLYRILEESVPVQDVKDWLDDEFEGVHEAAGNEKTSKFKHYDPLTFVVVILNFLREDAALLLAPSGERFQAADHSSPASIMKGDAADLPKTTDRDKSQQCLFPTRGFDISSADDFPALPLGELPRGTRTGSKQKRRIRPTPLSNAEKPLEGDITTLGATDSAAPSFGKPGEVATAHLKVRGHGLPPSLQRGKPSPSTAFKTAMAKTVVEAMIMPKASNSLPGGTKASAVLAKDHQQSEEGPVENERGITHLREATSGSMPERQGISLVQAGEIGTNQASLSRTSIEPMIRSSDRARSQEVSVSESTAASDPSSSCSNSEARTISLLQTPKKSAMAVSTSRFGGGVLSATVSCASPAPLVKTPTPLNAAPEKESRGGDDVSLSILASLYVHIMIRRLVPCLAMEMHLTIRLLHVNSEVTPGSIDRTLVMEQDHEGDPPSSRSTTFSSKDTQLGNKPGTKVVFKTGRDCRLFAASVLLGLKALLPHIGTDTLDLLAGSLAVASQMNMDSEEHIEDLRHVLCEAKGDGVNSSGNGSRNAAQQNADDTAIVQSFGAPFAALQWREADSLNNLRTTSDRSMFQNRQESVDRFGSLLRDYQGSKRGLQQYPERALQDLRTAASDLTRGLAPENFRWFAQYFLGQLVGWGLALPEETDSEVMALVAPAGDKGRATLQKLHRRISTPSPGEDGNAFKSSHKLRHPGASQSRQAHAEQERGSHHDREAGIRAARVGVHQPRSRKSSAAPRQGKGQAPEMGARVPTAPLQLRWFPGNQEFFYQVLLVLDSYTFNSHLKAEFVGEIGRLHRQLQQLNTFKTRPKGVGNADENGAASDASNSVAGEGIQGFTGTMVKLKVLAKFLGLLTFCPNWGISASESVSSTHEPPALADANEEARTTSCPLPLAAYLDHARSTAGLIGVVPWVADFLRMMKWDQVSAQANFYRHILGTLSKLHAEPCMRPGHPAFTESLLAVSCEVESLFQDLGFDLGVHGYRLSPQASKPVIGFGSPGERGVHCVRLGVEPAGSLDDQVVLSRRLIQNCCPYLEDILTLITSLGRAWKQGLVAGGNGTPFRAGQSPRVVGASGISPRSRRVIKPHPLKPIRALPSLHEQIQRRGNSDKNTESVHTASARLRLVEAFFHSLPDELQLSADFVVRRAVQNACEDVLVTVVRPAVAAAVRQVDKLDDTLRESITLKETSFAAGEEFVRPRVDQQIAWTTATLSKSIGPKARSLAGKRGNAIATATTLALVPYSLSLRVRQTAATIAGHHAQQAASKKIEEMTTATVSEAITACDLERGRKQLTGAGVESRSPKCQVVLASPPPRAPPPKLCALASKLCALANNFEGPREEQFLGTVHRVSICSINDVKADDLAKVMADTFYMVEAMRRCGDTSGIPKHTHGTYDACEEYWRTPAQPFGDQVTQDSNILENFLATLALFYGALPDHVWRSIRKGSTLGSVSTKAFGNLVHLAATALKRNEGEKNDGPSRERSLPLLCEPILRLLAWGSVSIVTAENIFLSCIQTATRGPTPGKGEGYPEACWDGTYSSSFKAVANAVVKGYHSLALGKDFSTVLLADLLDITVDVLTTADVAAMPFRYHPMDLCRLVARLSQT